MQVRPCWGEGSSAPLRHASSVWMFSAGAASSIGCAPASDALAMLAEKIANRTRRRIPLSHCRHTDSTQSWRVHDRLLTVSRALFAAFLLWAAPAFADAAYFAAIEDLPLPPGFTEVAGETSFESAEGRIVLAVAEGRASASQIRDFYSASLPELGWAFSPHPEGALVFQRGRETLTFTVREGAQRTRLSVRLVTHPVPTQAD
jgi:hypothetical protein